MCHESDETFFFFSLYFVPLFTYFLARKDYTLNACSNKNPIHPPPLSNDTIKATIQAIAVVCIAAGAALHVIHKYIRPFSVSL